MNYFIYTSRHFTPHGGHQLSKLTSLPMCGFIAQLVEHRTGITEVTGSNPVEALIFSGFFFPIAKIGKLTAVIILHFHIYYISTVCLTGSVTISISIHEEQVQFLKQVESKTSQFENRFLVVSAL